MQIRSTRKEMLLTDQQRIGIFLIIFASFFISFGIILFFDRGLLALGNIILIPGVSLVLGPSSTIQFLAQPTKRKGLACFLLGLFLLMIGRSISGFILEAIGFVNLFGNFFPYIFSFVKTLAWTVIQMAKLSFGR
eukprot:TRINITY_DN6806_c0_g1_i1.p2 TRINITY_DN6806_c0_g1~~TRINITY_DN6806_c0_g1_i1.p2  ORF type:complete len:135 (-),score=16.43 TRINITY_DN6806_c0_g1_i1:452-856(-)